MNGNIKKFLHIFRSPSLKAVSGWAGCIRGRLTAVCLIASVGVLFSLATTVLTKYLIDSATTGRHELMVLFSAALAAVVILERLLNCWNSVLRVHMSAALQKHMQSDVMTGILSRRYAGIKKYHSGDLVSRMFSDVAVVKNGIVGLLPNICSMLISLTGAVVILWTMDRRFILVVLAVSLLGAVFMLLFREPMKKRHKRMQEAESGLHASVQETLENIRTVKASLSEKQIMERVHAGQDRLESEQCRQGIFSMWMNQGLGFMFEISWLICMLWGCFSIFQGNMTYGSLAAMLQLIGRIQGPIARAADVAGQLYGVIASAERLQEVLQLPEEESGTQLRDFRSIDLQHVEFTYDDGNEQVLCDISCRISRGDFVALTGISGGGKTSLFQLLLGMYAPTSGRVLFETDEGTVEASRSTRSLFSYVPQGNTLISGTLRENFTLFRSNATDEQILRAADAACIRDLVDELGLDAVIGERGVGLSEGQAQRVAVARALLNDAPILLLDEATSALDDQTEARLLSHISAMKDRTCIIVTHRTAALAICNKQFHISDGHLTVVRDDENGH